MSIIPENRSFEPSYSPAIAAAKRKLDDANSEHKRLVDSGLYNYGQLVSLAGPCAQAFDEIMRTPATCLDDAGLKVVMSAVQLDEIAEYDSIPALTRALAAIRNGSASTAIKHLDAALRGDTDQSWAYEGLEIALADLRRLEVRP